MLRAFGLGLILWVALGVSGLRTKEPAVGSPDRQGRRRRVTPATGLQQALEAAQPGDLIVLAPGVYYESVHLVRSGKPGAPIVICAEDPGTATISGSAQADFELRFTQVEGDLYKAPVPWRVRWVMADGRNLCGYEDLEGLSAFRIIGHDTRKPEYGPPEGFAWEEGTLYVRLIGAQDPNAASVEIHRRYAEAEAELPATHYWGKPFRDRQTGGENISVEADHVVLSGLRLRLAPEVAVRVKGDFVTIMDCRIEGAFRGIKAGDSANLTVERCEFSCYPVYQWVRWGQSKYPDRTSSVWNAVYNSNLCATFLEHSGPGALVSGNLVYECFDGIQRHVHDRERPVTPELASEFSHNVIMSCGDECIEFDSTGPQNLRVHHNFFMDALALLALSPVQGGALMIDHNIAYVSPEYGLMPCTMFKFDCPWRTAWIDTPTRDCTIVHNTIVNGRTYLYWTGEDHSYENNVIENNIFWVRLSFPWKIEQLRPGPYNLYAGPNVEPEHLPGTIPADAAGFVVEPAIIPLKTPRLPVLPLRHLEEPDPAVPTVDRRVDFHLRLDSVAVNAGAPGNDQAYHHTSRGEGPDLGAIELGEEWQFPRPGPRWAVADKAPWRPALPPSLDRRWVGLGGRPEQAPDRLMERIREEWPAWTLRVAFAERIRDTKM